MPKAIDLLNQTFGNQLVVEKLPSKSGKTYWLCKCQKCGREKEFQTCHLRNKTYEKCCENNINDSQQQVCPICQKTFYPLVKGLKRKFCFECSPTYEKNSNEGRAQNITALRKAIKKRLVEYKGGKCCKCGYHKSLNALQFHHLNPEEKEFTISDNLKIGNFDIEQYYKEVDKCELVCANCHAEIHDKDYIQ